MKKIIIIDTETTPCDYTIEKVDPLNMFCYDISYIVCEIGGEILEKKSFINKEIFFGEEDLMANAFYSDKIPQYIEQIKNKESVVANLYWIRKNLVDDMKKYGVSEVYAHNMKFDYLALNNTQRWSTKSKYRYFFPYGTIICDSLKMAKDIFGDDSDYIEFCRDNEYLCKNGKPRMTAEILYRYLSHNNEFIEEHKGLDDVLIERQIIEHCYSQNKEMRIALFE